MSGCDTRPFIGTALSLLALKNQANAFIYIPDYAAARVRRATINEGVFMSIPFSILDTLKWMS